MGGGAVHGDPEPYLGTSPLPAPRCVRQPGSSPDPIVEGFYGGSITQAGLILSLAIGD